MWKGLRNFGASYPKGCTYDEDSAGGGGDRGVWFNTHATGSGKTDVFPLCVEEEYVVGAANSASCSPLTAAVRNSCAGARASERMQDFTALGWHLSSLGVSLPSSLLSSSSQDFLFFLVFLCIVRLNT